MVTKIPLFVPSDVGKVVPLGKRKRRNDMFGTSGSQTRHKTRMGEKKQQCSVFSQTLSKLRERSFVHTQIESWPHELFRK